MCCLFLGVSVPPAHRRVRQGLRTVYRLGMYAAIAAVSRGVRRDATSGKSRPASGGAPAASGKAKVFQRSESATTRS
jgi:hypothetical protein